MYQFICKTNLYHATRKSGFDKFTGIKVINTFDTLKEANDAILKGLCEDANRHFANWGMACIYASKPNDESIASAETRPDGTRRYERDIYIYSVREIK